MAGGIENIVHIVARQADAGTHHCQLLIEVKLAGKLLMPLVDEEGEGADIASIGAANGSHDVTIDGGDLFALLQIGANRGPIAGGKLKNQAAARASSRQAEDEARPVHRAAMMVGDDGQTAMGTSQQSLLRRYMGKAGVPDQRSIAKDPMGRGVGSWMHRHNLGRNLGKLA